MIPDRQFLSAERHRVAGTYFFPSHGAYFTVDGDQTVRDGHFRLATGGCQGCKLQQCVQFDEIHIKAYGTPKHMFATENDILFDDEEKNRTAWTGTAYDVHNIIEILKGI